MKCTTCGSELDPYRIPAFSKSEQRADRNKRIKERLVSIMKTSGEILYKLFISLAVFIAVSICGYSLWHTVVADGKVQYCYIEMDSSRIRVNDKDGIVDCTKTDCSNYDGEYKVVNYYLLSGFRAYRANRDLGKYNTIDEAKEAAGKISCQIQ